MMLSNLIIAHIEKEESKTKLFPTGLSGIRFEERHWVLKTMGSFV